MVSTLYAINRRLWSPIFDLFSIFSQISHAYISLISTVLFFFVSLCGFLRQQHRTKSSRAKRIQFEFLPTIRALDSNIIIKRVYSSASTRVPGEGCRLDLSTCVCPVCVKVSSQWNRQALKNVRRLQKSSPLCYKKACRIAGTCPSLLSTNRPSGE